ncbi:1672_t:CDS:2 [Funneliformis geosporum]|uniref:18833_t:CDS:1 n=1 Tax=Funneliformis geosporum TaxID=1117311 RepID=A0A9W4WS47_9GLOM|nr:18833_t:CDS:2 [Funneliformis geosporum]CAI2181629.1 1672_t:CDS:2 [Funneliformis geosporum]
MNLRDTRILVAIDFGTTYSGFAYAHKENPENVVVNNSWPGREGVFKTPTALQYDERYNKVINWGYNALVEEPDELEEGSDDLEEQRTRPVELFKLHLSTLGWNDKPWLPPRFGYKKAVKDYLSKLGELIKDTLKRRWPNVSFPRQVDFVFTIPAEWPPNTTRIMRECAHGAGLLSSLNSNNIEFTTEPEAAALHCLSVMNEHHLGPGDSFLVADCGGGTIDLTSRKLLPGNRLSEITERVGDLCGGSFIDKRFLKWLGKKLGTDALEALKSNHYGQMQFIVQRFFCQRIKYKFNGDKLEYRPLKLNVPYYCPDLNRYVTGNYKEQMEQVGWVLRVDFDSVVEMFDPIVNRIIKLLEDQLKSSREKCSAMFLVGGFSESPYLQRRVRESFSSKVPIISVPALPIAAIVRGAITYGFNIDIVQDRILKWTYGIEEPKKDKASRKTDDGLILYFHKLAQRGKSVGVDQKFMTDFFPTRPDQEIISFNIYYTPRYGAKFCDDPGMKLLGTLRVRATDTHLGLNRPIEFLLAFGKMEIKATAKNKRTGRVYNETTFDLDI